VTGLIALAFAALVASCGGSDGGTATGGSTTVSKGAIESFNSIVVNGIEFRVTGATLHLRDDGIDKVLLDEAEVRNHLEKGMVVTVKGKLDDNGLTGAATEIEFRDALTGRIDDKGVDFIKVMGQTILLDDNARMQLAGLAINDNVRISGLADDKGGLRATHIKLHDDPAEFEVKGFVSGYSGGNTMTLLLSPTATSGLSIDLASALLPAGGIKNGDFVEVKSAVSPANGAIVAIRVELEDEIEAVENENAEFEGFVANLTGSTFMIGDMQVSFGSATIFRNGVAADLVNGAKVEAEGNILDGILMAGKITFKDNLRINAVVTAVDPGGTALTILDRSVMLPANLEIREDGNVLAPEALAGRVVDLRGMAGADGLIMATRLDVKNNDPDEATLRGPVSASSSSDNRLTIAGITVNTAGTVFKGNDAEHSTITAAQFFAAIADNVTVVKVRWDPFTSVSAPPKEIELEN
jgi:hypothetical protein